ncbi:sensor histidine kinase [Corallincola holothuriorum]|uniref:histidine kinase n=1 Tax=Corallincola holothuriorum TaxID=2282215 RepID=A0A368NNP3_9GAMM|nr:HAMP domain-containing sensor histidine kinase [Corallincola holothuriorum]RCU51786.1 sensor histidine kinase [Corallincola holothuriorum]
MISGPAWFNRLQNRLLTYMAVATLLPLIVLGGVTYQLSVNGLTQQAETLTQELIEERAASVALMATNTERLANRIAQNDAVAELLLRTQQQTELSRIEKLKLQSRIEAELSSMIRANDLLAVEIITDDSIFGVGDVAADGTYDTALFTNWLQQCQQREQVLCWPGIEHNTHIQSPYGLVLPALYSLKEFDEQLVAYQTVGFLVLKFSISALYDYTHSQNQDWMYHIIVDQKNRIIYHPSQSKIGQTLALNTAASDDTARFQATLFNASEPLERHLETEITNMGWRTIGVIPQSRLQTNARLISQLTIGCIAFSLLLMILAMLYIARRIILPIRTVTEAKPNSESMHPITTQYSIQEINQLVQWFNDYTSIVSNERTQQRELKRAYDTLQQTQKQLIESEKMAALGNLVAGVAHEINTPLGVAITASSMVLEKTEIQQRKLANGELKRSDLDHYFNDGHHALNLTLNNLHRAAQLVQTFKQVAADQHQEHKQELLLQKAISDVFVSLGPQFKRFDVTTHLNCDKSLKITSYPGIVWQVISNLMTNSYKHGFHPKDKGEIRVDVEAAESWVIVTYQDSGQGISPQDLPHIFDPFFTTQRNQGGTGLGLNIVYNLVTQNLGGTIRCDSKLGSGVAFTINLPYIAP